MSCYQCGSPKGNEAQLCPECTENRIRARQAVNLNPVYGEATDRYQNVRPRLLVVILIGIVLLLGLLIIVIKKPSIISSSKKPTEAEVYEPIKEHLLGRTCKGTRVINSLSIEKVGDYDSRFAGFPVYSQYSVTCEEGNSSVTWNSSPQSEQVVTAWVRSKIAGGYEAFVPEIFQTFEKQMGEEFNKALKGLRVE